MKTLHTHAVLLLALGVLLATASSCGGDEDPAMGQVSVQMTDAPGDFVTAVVTIDEIYLQGSGGRTVLSNHSVTTNLLTLANDTVTLVDHVHVEEGSYSQLRFVISGAYIEVENEEGGTTIYATDPDYAGLPDGVTADGELQTPSFDTSGVKVKLDGDTFHVDGEHSIILVDFDVAQSFGKAAGNSGRWVMKPVIKGANIELSANLTVRVTPGDDMVFPVVDGAPLQLGALEVVLTNENGDPEALSLLDADADGTFEATFRYLLPGSFEVTLRYDEEAQVTTLPASPVSVALPSGADESVSLELLLLEL